MPSAEKVDEESAMSGMNLIQEIDSLLSEVTSIKAAESSASDAGKVQNQGDAGTSHPSKSVDDGTQEGTTGARAAENTSDVKSDIPGQPVDSAKEDKMNGASESPVTTAKATGEDSANETSSAGPFIGGDAGKDHQGKDTTHPAKVDFGGKYASMKEAAQALSEYCNSFNAKVAALNVTSEQPADNPAKKQTASKAMKDVYNKAVEKSTSTYDNADEEAGEKAASLVLSKLGSDEQQTLIENLVKEAVDDADRLVDFYSGVIDGSVAASREDNVKEARAFAKKLQRQVASKMTKSAMPPAAPVQGEEAGADAMAYGGEGEAPDTPGEGAGGGHESAGGGHGGADLMASMAGGEGGGMEAGEEGGDIPPELIDQIAQELEAAGVDPEVLASIPPEDLAEAITEAEAGDEGGMEGGEGYESEMPAPELDPAPAG